jgi:hypothetical protein
LPPTACLRPVTPSVALEVSWYQHRVFCNIVVLTPAHLDAGPVRRLPVPRHPQPRAPAARDAALRRCLPCRPRAANPSHHHHSRFTEFHTAACGRSARTSVVVSFGAPGPFFAGCWTAVLVKRAVRNGIERAVKHAAGDSLRAEDCGARGCGGCGGERPSSPGQGLRSAGGGGGGVCGG